MGLLEGYEPVRRTGRDPNAPKPPPDPKAQCPAEITKKGDAWEARTTDNRHYFLILHRTRTTVTGTITNDSGATGSINGKVAVVAMEFAYNVAGQSGKVNVVWNKGVFAGPEQNRGSWKLTRCK